MEINGVLPIFKSQNMTSHDVVAITRRTISMKQVGHTGTLDPMATGVLPICVGNGTRIIEYLDLDLKTYDCKMELGYLTDTLDVWGTVIETGEIPDLSFDKVSSVINSYKGVISQIPPAYSAIKINGKRLYSYARAGETVEIPERKIYIDGIELLGFEDKEVHFRVTCSKGTYIRSLCRDIGEDLGTLATMTFLSREKTGTINRENCVSIEDFRNMEAEEIEKILLPVESLLNNLGKIRVNDEKVFNLINGGKISARDYMILSEPLAREMDFSLEIGPHMYSYLIYGKYGDEDKLLGIGTINEDVRFLKGNKILLKRD